MEKYKLCPFCKTKNRPQAIECENCEADISTVKITDEAAETIKAPQQEAKNEKTFVRVCEECGHANRPNARICEECGEDISHIVPTEQASDAASVAEADAETKVCLRLVTLDGEYSFALNEGSTTVGRECEMKEYLATKDYVSRRHALFTLENGKLMFENLSHSNYSYVNNEKITVQKVELHDGDIIGLGGNEKNGKRQDMAAYFILRNN